MLAHCRQNGMGHDFRHAGQGCNLNNAVSLPGIFHRTADLSPVSPTKELRKGAANFLAFLVPPIS